MNMILVADDERRIVRLVSDFLRNAGFEVINAEDGQTALKKFHEYRSRLSLVILDVMMPIVDGWDVLKEIRSVSDIYVIMLTAKGEDSDQLTGFKNGADDYVLKPFSPSVLVARVQNLLKRAGRFEDSRIEYAGFILDLNAHTLVSNGMIHQLTPKEFDLLVYLINNKGLTLSREKLLNAVWNYDYYGDPRTVDTHVKQLRSKISSDVIQTVRGYGYRIKLSEEIALENNCQA